MGLDSLVLVDPQVFPSAEATSLASGASDVLAKRGWWRRWRKRWPIAGW